MKKLNAFRYKILLIVVEVAISIFILYTGSLFAGIFGLLCALYLIYTIYKAMKSDDAYKQMIIKDNDERMNLIVRKAAYISSTVTAFAILIAGQIAFSQRNILAFVLCFTLAFIYVISMGIAVLYYKRKY